MRVLGSLPRRGPRARPLALALGVFDGLHRGHLAVLRAALGQARARGWEAAALSFDPPPEAALGLPVPPRLQHPREQVGLLEALGFGLLLRLPFTRSLGRLQPAAFAARVLAERLRCGGVAVGRGFRFGAGARGTVDELRRLGRSLGFEVWEVAPVRAAGRPLSSTRLRAAVQAGRLAEAGRLLGRPWRLRGKVVEGRRLGRRLGFPTANLQSPQQVLPPQGVWAGRCRVAGQPRWWGFAANIGVRPSLGRGLAPSVELHLLGFRGNLRGRELEAEFLKRLRGERRFPSLEALQAQIARDAAAARRFLGRGGSGGR